MTQAASRFLGLYEGLCDIVQAPRFPLEEAAEGSVAFHLNRQGVVVNVLHFPQTCADHAFILFEFGPVPHDDPRAYQILLALLDVNFLLPQAHPPALGRNPATGDVVLRCVYPLSEATPAACWNSSTRVRALALEWRQDFFLAQETAAISPSGLASALAEVSRETGFVRTHAHAGGLLSTPRVKPLRLQRHPMTPR